MYFLFFPIYAIMGMLGPRDRENPMRETTAYRAISISSHMVGIPGHCEKECDFKIRNNEIQHWDPTGGHGTPRRDPFFWLHTSTHTLPTSPGPLQSKLCLGKYGSSKKGFIYSYIIIFVYSYMHILFLVYIK